MLRWSWAIARRALSIATLWLRWPRWLSVAVYVVVLWLRFVDGRSLSVATLWLRWPRRLSVAMLAAVLVRWKRFPAGWLSEILEVSVKVGRSRAVVRVLVAVVRVLVAVVRVLVAVVRVMMAAVRVVVAAVRVVVAVVRRPWAIAGVMSAEVRRSRTIARATLTSVPIMNTVTMLTKRTKKTMMTMMTMMIMKTMMTTVTTFPQMFPMGDMMRDASSTISTS